MEHSSIAHSASALVWAAPYCCVGVLLFARPHVYAAHRERVWVGVGWCRVVVKVLMVAGVVRAPFEQIGWFTRYGLDLCVEAVMYVMCEGVRARVLAPIVGVESLAVVAINHLHLRLYGSLGWCVARGALWLAAVLTSAAVNERWMRASFERSKAVHAKAD